MELHSLLVWIALFIFIHAYCKFTILAGICPFFFFALLPDKWTRSTVDHMVRYLRKPSCRPQSGECLFLSCKCLFLSCETSIATLTHGSVLLFLFITTIHLMAFSAQWTTSSRLLVFVKDDIWFAIFNIFDIWSSLMNS